MSTVKTIARLALGGAVVGSTVVGSVTRWQDRRATFAAAQQRARFTGRRLVVVGDLHAGMQTRVLPAYGCGDVCVDLDACPQCPTSESVNLDTGRASVTDNSAVVFVSCVLEYVSDPQTAMREIDRMAGSPENVFLVTVQPWTLVAALYPGARHTIARQSDGSIVATPVTLTRKVATVGVLAGLAWAAW